MVYDLISSGKRPVMTSLIPVKTCGKRRKFVCNVNEATPLAMDAIAKEFGCRRIDCNGHVVGSVGLLLDKIARGEIELTFACE
jgi:hypothetical protein